MKTVRLLSLSVFIALTIYSCTKDRNLPIPSVSTSLNCKIAGILIINEFMASGSSFKNEFNSNSDWIEIYNSTDDTLALKQGEWFITDSIQSPEKFQLPEIKVLPKGYFVVWCDDASTTAKQVHTNFKLSSGGEDVALFYKSNEKLVLVDAYSYGSQTSGFSLGRLPDGSGNWAMFAHPTPGNKNENKFN